MSLLNKMLADLETRAGEISPQSGTEPVLAGLRAVSAEPRNGTLRWILWLALLAGVSLASVRWYPQLQPYWSQAVASVSSKVVEQEAVASAPPLASVNNAENFDAETESASPQEAPVETASAPSSANLTQEAPGAQQDGEPVNREAVVSTPPAALLDAPRSMAAAEFVAVPPPSVLGSIETLENTPVVDPLAPAAKEVAKPVPTPTPPAARPATKVSVVRPSAPDRLSNSEIVPASSSVAVAPRETQTIERPTEKRADAANHPNDRNSTPAPKPAAKIEFNHSTDATLVKAQRPLSIEEQAQHAHVKALQLLSEGRLAEAEETFRKVLGFNPAHVDARVALAELLRDQARAQEAQSLLEDGLTVASGATVLRQWLARLYVDQGLTERALTTLEEGRPFAQEDGEYVAVLAAYYQQAGQFKAAADAYRQALVRDAQQGRWWMGLGLALESDGQPVVAAQAYERALGATGLPGELIAFTRARLAAARQQPR